MKATILRFGLLALIASTLSATATDADAASPAFSETADQIWMTNGAGRVLSFAKGGNTVFVGGSFTGMRATYDGSTVTQKYVAALDMWSGELLSGFDPTVNNEVRAVAVSPDSQTVYIGGKFTSVNGETRTKVAALDATTGNVRNGWDVEIPSGNVEALAVDAGGNVYIGGSFNIVQNQGQRALAKVDGATGALKSWDAGIGIGKVKSLLMSPDGTRLYVGTESNDENGQPILGAFHAVNPANANAISGFNASAVNRPVFDISVSSDKIYLALGGGGGAADILRVSNGSRRVRYYTDGDVQGVQVVGDRAYFAGHWVDDFGPTDSFHFTSVDTATDQIDDSYYPRLNGVSGVQDMLYDGAHLWLGGHITNGNPVAVRGFARYSATGPGANLTPLVRAGAEWIYLDDGSQLGSGWRNLGYNDSAWSTGDAELGYGDGDEETVVNDGPNGNRHITTYFRRVVTVWDHNRIEHLEIRLKRDDGAVVYLNGTEIIRDNMPGGSIDGATLAASATNGGGEDTFNRWILPTQHLVEGENIVAVEVHQVSPTSNDVSFDMRMLVDRTPQTFVDSGATWTYLDTGASLGTGWRNLGYNDSAWREGQSQLGYGEGDEQKVIRKGPDGDRHITSYFRKVFTVYDLEAIPTLELELLRDDGAVVYLNGSRVVRSNMPSGPINSETVAAAAAKKPSEQNWFRYSINPSKLVVGDNILAVEVHQRGPGSNDHSFDARLVLQASPEQLLARDVKWRYHDKGKDKGSAWRQADYANHSNWKRGKAELGYGDGDEATVVNSGPAGDHHPTTYFRRRFIVTDPDVFSFLDIGLVRDDGAVVYVNGIEVIRDNMPAGTISYETLASGGASGEDVFHYFSVPASMLVAGGNYVAVEIHQSGPGSSDISFNLEMTAR
ncbi:MAG: hypothetical protein GY720_12365 [bacterium]|nr:hypothetical protein [bacterium]